MMLLVIGQQLSFSNKYPTQLSQAPVSFDFEVLRSLRL